MGCDVSFAKPCLKDEEEIARLLSSPNSTVMFAKR